MRYLSTRGGEPVRAAEAIVRGISPSGGLYVPEEYPQIQVETGEREQVDVFTVERDGEDKVCLVKEISA